MRGAHGKSDMERVGVFQEMSFLSGGDTHGAARGRSFNESAHRRRQMQSGVPRQRCALQDGFFDTSFKRIFEREALSEPLRLIRQNRIQQNHKNLSKAFLPSDGHKRPCGSGTYYGTLSGPVAAMSAQSVSRSTPRSQLRNFVTSPAKKGSGSSYPNLGLSRDEPLTTEPYDRLRQALKREAELNRLKIRAGPFKLHLHPKEYFQMNPYHSNRPLPPAHRPLPPAQKTTLTPFKPPASSKQMGGMKAGTFDPYPSHSVDPYDSRRTKAANQEPVFRPAAGLKSTPVNSIITLNVNRRVRSSSSSSSSSALPLITF